jgi:glycosyltransferase involved in cell wall biosynthesis
MNALIRLFRKHFSRNKAAMPDGDIHALIVDAAYKHILGRFADPVGLRSNVKALENGLPVSELFQRIALSDEARLLRVKNLGKQELTDGEFIACVGEFLFPVGGATPADIERWRRFLREAPAARVPFVWDRFMEAHEALQLPHHEQLHDPSRVWIMGTPHFLTMENWQKRKEETIVSRETGGRTTVATGRTDFKHTGEFVVSAIASLYRGKKFLKTFLDNITSQTIFDRSELIIIDADSPEGEWEIIEDYQRRYPNIVYKRINYKIGIYDAWNIGVELSRGRYLTNVNLDDLRRRDSFELQSSCLDRHKFADITYQDFFYSLEPLLSFDEVVALGFKAELPLVTPHSLLAFNLPHNAPMWRRNLHDEVGLFDTSYKSAGDWEFWLRCIAQGKSFFKLNTPHVVYFQNPEGISTRPDSKGIEEAGRILKHYGRKLISKHLTMSRSELASEIGAQPDWDWNSRYYDVVQKQLRRLGESQTV